MHKTRQNILTYTLLLLVASCLFAVTVPVETQALCSGSSCASNQSPGFTGKPISLYTGEETLNRTDLSIGNISFERKYSSRLSYGGTLGFGWTYNYDIRLTPYPDGSVTMRRADRSRTRFKVQNDQFISPAGETGTLIIGSYLKDSVSQIGYIYTDKNGVQEIYDQAGILVREVNPSGTALEFTHASVPNASSPNEVRLVKVEEMNAAGLSTGRSLTLHYDPDINLIVSMTDNLNRTVNYGYDTNQNLTTVTTASMTSTYGYNDPTGKHLMTDITEGGAVYSNTYDTLGRVIRQMHGDGIIDIDYITPMQKTKTTTTIKDAAKAVLNVQTRTVEFNDSGQPVKVTDTFGNETRYARNALNLITREEHSEKGTLKYSVTNTYDAKGNLLTRKEGGATAEKTTIYTYEPVFNKVLTETVKSVVDPGQNKVTTYDYDSRGNATAVVETGYLGDGTAYSYTTTFGYNSDSRITQIDGPMTDVQDVTTFSYDTNGNLLSMTQPLIGATTYSNHDSFGNPQTITDPNGNVTTYTYDGQGRVLTIKAPEDSAATTYTYVSGGCASCGGGGEDKIASITFPEGNGINYSYDAYGNLTTITDNLGNNINYTYDSEGNRLKEDIKDAGGALQKTLAYQYDALNRLKKIINPDSTYTEYSYDGLGNRISLRNPNTGVTGYKYDALSRLTEVTQPGSVKTSYGYDTNDDLTNVTDANGNATTYRYDDMGRVYEVISPDTGATTYTYDPAGDMRSKTDAMGVTINYSYDALNRLTKIDFPTDADVFYTYDNCLNGKGRLCGITDVSGTTSYEYTVKGQIEKEKKVIDGVTYVTQYAYNGNGDVMSITYPGGRVVNYIYVTGMLKGITMIQGGTTISLASNISYQAFGGIKSLVYGNGLNRTITYDNQGRIGTIVTGGIQNVTYGYDANSNITGITDNLPMARNKTYVYDALDRLTDATGPWGTLNYTYDGVGNRKTETTGTGTTNYTYSANKLISSTGVKTLAFGYDGNGNTTSENGRQYAYSQNQRLIKAAKTNAILGEYVYNANGQRAKKVVDGSTTIFHFDNGGRLIAETDNSGNVGAQYAYLSGQPIAKIDSSDISYIHTDHLGTPVLMTDSAGLKVWEIESKPFGDDAGINGAATLNIRFPGQYYDAETGLYYNYFRDYDPKVGRYVEVDPIGLYSGLVVYSYVQNNPSNWFDPYGLWREDVHSGIGNSDYGTYKWAKDIGMPEDIARKIAASTNAADSYANYLPLIGTPDRHFKTGGSRDTRDIIAQQNLEYAIRNYKAGNGCVAFKLLGIGLHALQDKIAHGQWPFYRVHPPWFDEARLRPDALVVTEVITKKYILDFVREVNK